MIIIDILLDSNDILQHLEVKGHSGYKCKGSDIVCASVSCLVLTSYILFKQMLSDNVKLIKNICTKDENVIDYEVVLYPDGLKGQLQGATAFLLTGLTQIQKQYIENVKININLR